MKKIVAIVLAIGIVVAFLFVFASHERIKEKVEHGGGKFVFARYVSYSVIIIMNVFLLLALFLLYADSYLKTKSNFTLGLLFFIGILLIQSILSLPIIRAIFGLNYFFPLPHLFETLALTILLILSME